MRKARYQKGRPLHSCIAATTHLKFLADWILIRGVGIASPGDLLEWLGLSTLTPGQAAGFALMIKQRADLENRGKRLAADGLV